MTGKDILLANSVIHTIDHFLNPEERGDVLDLEIATSPPPFDRVTNMTSMSSTTAIPCTASCTKNSADAAATGGAGESVYGELELVAVV